MDVPRDRYGRPRVYLEEECPVAELSIESQRERGASSALPPLYFLHVWWARRPLTVSRAAVLGSLLPAGVRREDFLEMMGIPKGKDPVAEKARIDEANRVKVKLKVGFSYGRAFSIPISEAAINRLKESYRKVWGTDSPVVLDSFAGGGSIPFEAVRVGCQAVANELNPVASVIQMATIEYPRLFGKPLADDIRKWGSRIESELRIELADCFPKKQGEEIFGYIWVRTVRCPKCDLQVPLAPNWWLDSENNIGYKLVLPSSDKEKECRFTIEKISESFDPDEGSVDDGTGTCPRCATVLEKEHIKREAREGRMGHQLAAVGYKISGKSGRHFREVEEMDLRGVEVAKELLKKRLPEWERKGLVPDEEIPEGNKTREPRNSGMLRWRDMFSPRQLLVHLTTLEKILEQPWDEIKDRKKREALRVYMQLVIDVCVDWNSVMTIWNPGRPSLAHTFQRHDFAFKWSYGEIDGAGSLFRFGYEQQMMDAYGKICGLLQGAEGRCEFLLGDAARLSSVKDKSIQIVCIDPPYYDNVMYSECSDFFYVWMKRGLSDVFPSLFNQGLTDKESETVANASRFKSHGRGKAHDLADRDYEAKMASAFKEMHRVLKDDGVMTVMFTHKKVEAWDALAYGLLEADFEITASWPVHTEFEHSLHQAKKNAAASTILLVCRKRPEQTRTSWWEETQARMDEAVTIRAQQFMSQGLRGQDVFIACFGPALQVISENWPVKKKDGSIIRPEEALDRARTIVSAWFMERLSEGKADILDPRTRFYILAWHIFRAREFPYDEARKLGVSLNVEVEDLIRDKLLEKRGSFIKIKKPQERFRDKAAKVDAKSYDHIIDYVQAAMYAYEEGKSAELNRFHQRTGALAKEGYKEAIAYLLDVLPRTEEVVEYKLLNEMWESNYRDQVRRKPRSTDPTGRLQTRLETG